MISKVYIIILNHNGFKDTIECLESVFKLDYTNFQIIVVDNSPTEESIKIMKSWVKGEDYLELSTSFPNIVYPLTLKPLDYIAVSEEEFEKEFYDEQLVIIKARENLGFSHGNNIAINYAMRRDDYGYCWILNNDTVVVKDSLKNQIQYMSSRDSSKIGILGSKLLHYYQPNKIQSIGGIFKTNFFISKQLGEGLNVDTNKDIFPSIDYVVGASMLVLNVFLKEVGTLSEDYFLYYEELDWTYRAKEKGWKIDWCAESIVYHKEGATIGTSSIPKNRSLFSETQVFKSRKIFCEKYHGKGFMFWFSSLLIIGNRIRRFQFKLALALFKILLFK